MIYDFVDVRVSFLMTVRSPQSELYNSRYDHFGGTHRVQIIVRLKFVANALRTFLSLELMNLAANIH